MKRLRKLALMCAACIAFTGSVAAFPDIISNSFIVHAAEGNHVEIDGIDYIVYTDYAKVLGRGWEAKENNTTVKILSDINGIPVTYIDEEAFDGDSMTSLVIPDSITSIGRWAFDNCTDLITISIGSGITNISELRTPLSSPSLESVTVSADNPEYSSSNGILFNKDQTEILEYPKSKPAKKNQ